MTALPNPATFALAGNATFSLRSTRTGELFTYRVRPSQDMFLIEVLVGNAECCNWRYFGFVRRGTFFHGGAKVKIANDAPAVQAFRWFWRNAQETL